jgi:hypothetical protein
MLYCKDIPSFSVKAILIQLLAPSHCIVLRQVDHEFFNCLILFVISSHSYGSRRVKVSQKMWHIVSRDRATIDSLSSRLQISRK